MNRWQINKKLILGAAALIVVLIAAFLGSRFAAYYYYKEGVKAYSQNNFAVAKSNFATSLIFDSKNPITHYFIGKIALGIPAPKTGNYYPQADYKEMVSHYEKAVSLDLEQKNRRLYEVALDDLGSAYWNLNELDKAREKYFEKLSKFPDSSFWARYFIALDDYNHLNKPEEALETLLPALNLAKSDNDGWNLFRIHALLALLNLYFEDYANTEKYAKLVVENVDSENKNWEVQTAHALLALNYGRQKKFSLAEGEIKKANDLAGLAGAYDCFLGAAYTVGKNYSKAISVALKTAKTVDDNTSSVCLRVLAISYLAQGDKIKAKQYMEEYLSFTEKLPEKNIFVMRNQEQFEDELQKIK